MAERVVDRLKLIEIEDEHCKAAAAVLRQLQPFLDGGEAGTAVEQACERVVISSFLQRFFCLLPFRDIKGGAQDGWTAIEVDGASREVDPTLQPVLGEDLDLVAARDIFPALPGHAAFLYQFSELRMDDVPEVHLQQFVAIVVGYPLSCRVDVTHFGALEDERGCRTCFGHRAELTFAFA